MVLTKLQSPFLNFNFCLFTGPKKPKRALFLIFHACVAKIRPKCKNKKWLCNFVRTIAKNLYANLQVKRTIFQGGDTIFLRKRFGYFFSPKFSKSLKFDPKMPKKGPSNWQFFHFFLQIHSNHLYTSRANFWDIWTHFSLKIAIFRQFLTPFYLITNIRKI